jgi:protein associated with RNAse G/E
MTLLTNTNMNNIEKQKNDVRCKIRNVKENHNNKYKYPRDILAILSLREMQLEDYIFNSRAVKTF